MSRSRSIGELAEAETTPLADKLRTLGIQYTSSGNPERAKGYMHAADVVDEDLRALTGRALVEALDRMIEHRLERFAENFVADVVAALRDGQAAPAVREARAPPPRPTSILRPAPAPSRRPEGLGSGERKVLTAIAQHGREGVTLAQLQVLTGYAARTRQNLVQSLSARGFVARGGRALVATDRGQASLGPSFAPLPTGRALLDHWLAELGEGERTVLGFVVRFYPHVVSVERIDEQTGYAPRTRQNIVQALTSRHLLMKTGRGFVQACDHLFDPKPEAAGAR